MAENWVDQHRWLGDLAFPLAQGNSDPLKVLKDFVVHSGEIERPGVQIGTQPRLNSSDPWSSLLTVFLDGDSGGGTHDRSWREYVALP